MTRTRVLIDIRKHRGDSSFAVKLVSCYCSRISGAVLRWLVRADQACLVPPEDILGQASESDKSWGPRIHDQIVLGNNQDGGANGGASLVLSYDNTLLSEIRAASNGHCQVTAMHISELFRMGIHKDPRLDQSSPFQLGANGARRARDGWKGPHSVARSLFFDFKPSPLAPLTIDEAEQLAKKVLQEGSHTSPNNGLPQKDLRPRMSMLDPRAARRLGDPSSEALITLLVDRGLQEGWLKRIRRIPERTGTEMLYVAEQAQTELTTVQSTVPQEEPSKANSLVNGTPSGHDNIDDVTAQSASEPNFDSSKPKKHPNRATDFEAILSRSRIGAMPETRERILEAVAGIVNDQDGMPVPLLQLFTRAVAKAQESAERDGYCVEKNWPVARLCVRRLMLWAGVLLDQEGQPISDKIGSSAKQVATLAEDFRQLCEAYLIEHIIEKFDGINYDDDQYYLGLTIYRRGKERAVSADELKAKADAILSYLEENGRVFMDSARMVRVNKPAKPRALAVAG